MKLFDVYPLYDITPVSAHGTTVIDKDGAHYLDLYGGHAVISIGHSHPHYVKRLKDQIDLIGFYSNAIQNPLQVQLAEKLGKLSDCEDYQLFMCNSGAEANENALKVASFITGKKRVIAFNNAFHGRTSAAVMATDNPKIQAPINTQQEVSYLPFEDTEALETELAKGDVCAVIIECIQGVGGLDMPSHEFTNSIAQLSKKYGAMVIADEVQSGYGRSGKFFAFQNYGLQPDIITIAKGMGNGFPVAGVLLASHIEPWMGMLGTTFGGNHLACAASLAVLEVIEDENLIENAANLEDYFRSKAAELPQIKALKGKGLMLGMEFDFEVAALRKKLILEHHIFTGAASNKNLLRILPALNVTKQAIDQFFDALKIELS
jgi:acetylornithine/N-succinyldiaminopimelate aminotransferase